MNAVTVTAVIVGLFFLKYTAWQTDRQTDRIICPYQSCTAHV